MTTSPSCSPYAAPAMQSTSDDPVPITIWSVDTCSRSAICPSSVRYAAPGYRNDRSKASIATCRAAGEGPSGFSFESSRTASSSGGTRPCTCRDRNETSGGASVCPSGSRAFVPSVAAAAVGLSLMNPHAWLDTVVILGSVAGGYATQAARIAFTGGAITASLVFFLALGYGAAKLAPVFERPLAWKLLDVTVAVVMWSVAASLLVPKLTG